jgi:hypothetical protein
MQEILTSLPNTFIGWIGVLTVLVFGAVAIYGLFDKRQRERRKETDGSEDRLMDILSKTVTELQKKVDKQTSDIDGLIKEVGELKRDNEKYIKIFQGRDETTTKFYEQAFESMKLAKDTHDAVTTMVKNMEVTNTNATKLIELLGKHLEVLDHKTQN